jgi:hypothetical protein
MAGLGKGRMKATIKRKLDIQMSKKRSLATPKDGKLHSGGGSRFMRAHYFHERLGISFRIIGLLFEDERYEIYHARNKKYDRDIILHFMKQNGKRRFNVPTVNFERVAASAQAKPPKEVNLPWDNRSERMKGH